MARVPVIPIRYMLDPFAMLGVLDELKRTTKDPSAPGLRKGYLAATKTYLRFIVKRFLKLSKGGGGWPRLKPSTIRAKGGDTRILIRTGRLLRSLSPGTSDNVIAVDRKGATFGTMVPYATYHQTGTSKMRRRAIFVRPDPPTRKAMQVNLRNAVQSAIKDAIRRKAKRRTQRTLRPAA